MSRPARFPRIPIATAIVLGATACDLQHPTDMSADFDVAAEPCDGSGICTTSLDQPAAYEKSMNMHLLGFSPRAVPPPSELLNTDLAFWGQQAFQGTYEGFRVIDVSDPENPWQIVNYTGCTGNQGDLVIWENVLVRSWNSPAPASATCGGQSLSQGFEGLNIFDISDPANPQHVAAVDLPCGSHTATGVPDPANNRLLIYNAASSGACPGLEIVEVPLADPASATLLWIEPALRPCHDTAVILGTENMAACAGGDGMTVWSLDPALGGSLVDPELLYTVSLPGVAIGHTASFTWDGRVLVFDHEPGGGGQARCQSTSSTTDRSIYFFDARTGAQLGTFLFPRPQSSTENCTWHNFNIVPRTGAYVLVSGNYQGGISVVDFTDPATAREIAFADPPPLNDTQIQIGGAWSAYWYNGLIYESDIRRGLVVWRLSDPAVAGATRLDHLNPQTILTSELRGRR